MIAAARLLTSRPLTPGLRDARGRFARALANLAKDRLDFEIGTTNSSGERPAGGRFLIEPLTSAALEHTRTSHGF